MEEQHRTSGEDKRGVKESKAIPVAGNGGL
jgi:hypothetical protein